MFLGEVTELQFRELQFLSGKFDNSDILHNITIQSNSQCRIVRFVLRFSLVTESSDSESFKTSTSIDYRER